MPLDNCLSQLFKIIKQNVQLQAATTVFGILDGNLILFGLLQPHRFYFRQEDLPTKA